MSKHPPRPFLDLEFTPPPQPSNTLDSEPVEPFWEPVWWERWLDRIVNFLCR